MSADEDDDSGGEDLAVDALRDRLDALEARLESAETEADLDEIEADLETLASDVDDADLPEADDEDDEDPAADLEEDVDAFASDLEAARGPYAEDVVAEIDDAAGDIEDTRWTEQGETELREVVGEALADVNAALGTDLSLSDDEALVDRLVATLETTGAAIEEAALDPDDDAETIEALLGTADDLGDGVDDAQSWDDLAVREKLEAQGYYDVLDHVKDYPPEWHALKVHEKRGDAEMILLALDMLDSDFMEEHCLEALRRMGPEAAIEPMLERAGKRDQDAIRILGAIGEADDEVVETLLDYVDNDSNPLLQKVTHRALGEIGTEDAVQPIADELVTENDEVRSGAARALGLIGDTRAIDPLADVLADDDAQTVRASAAWALYQIGTEDALEAAAEYADDRAYLVQAEAERAAEAVADAGQTVSQ